MNKKVFSVQIELPNLEKEGFSPISKERIEQLLEKTFLTLYRCQTLKEMKISAVEQSVEPSQNKTIQLLEKAESVLSDSEHRYHWAVSQELRNHLDELQGKNKEYRDKY